MSARVLVTARTRVPERLPSLPQAEDPVVLSLPAGRVWLAGGEPTLRADLPAIVALGEDVGLETDGLALVRPGAVRVLRGLRAVRIALHSHVSAAHDWLVGMPGAAARARRAVRACREAGLAVEVFAVATLPTAHHLPETAALARALGASAFHVRRPVLRGWPEAIGLSPRLALLGPALRAAARAAPTRFEGFPPCVAPPGPTEVLVVPPPLVAPAPGAGGRCLGCARDCPGLPADYFEVFGGAEARLLRVG